MKTRESSLRYYALYNTCDFAPFHVSHTMTDRLLIHTDQINSQPSSF
jgi:hypothetical protein